MPAAEGSAGALIPEAVAIVAAVALLAALPVLVLRYRYRIEGGLLVIRRAVLGVIPVGEHRIRLSEIVAVEPCGRWRGGRYCLNYGSLLSSHGVRLRLRRRYMMYDSIRITPGEAERFVEEVAARVGAGARGQGPGARERQTTAKAKAGAAWPRVRRTKERQ